MITEDQSVTDEMNHDLIISDAVNILYVTVV